MPIRSALDDVAEAIGVLAATNGSALPRTEYRLGPTGRAAILAVAAHEAIGAEATIDRIAAIAGVAPRTFRYRNDGEYLKYLLELDYLRCVGDTLRLGRRLVRG